MNPVWVALIPVVGVIAAGLIAGLFALAGKRSDQQLVALHAAEEARKDLLEDYRERIKLLTIDRDEARAEREEMRVQRDESRHQVLELEKMLAELGRPTRGVKLEDIG